MRNSIKKIMPVNSVMNGITVFNPSKISKMTPAKTHMAVMNVEVLNILFSFYDLFLKKLYYYE